MKKLYLFLFILLTSCATIDKSVTYKQVCDSTLYKNHVKECLKLVPSYGKKDKYYITLCENEAKQKYNRTIKLLQYKKCGKVIKEVPCVDVKGKNKLICDCEKVINEKVKNTILKK